MRCWLKREENYLKYQFFLDETGDHGLSYIDSNFPIFLLCGCLFKESDFLDAEIKTNEFKTKYFGTQNVILHSRDIRKCEGPFQILFDLEIKKHFYEDLNKIMDTAKFVIIGAGVHKEKHIKKYGKGANDPYGLSLSFVMERLIFCLDKSDKNAVVEIKVEKRGTKEDEALLRHYNSIFDRGTYYVSQERLRERIKSFGFFSKRDNLVGLQIADLCAYPLARHLIYPDEPYLPFGLLESKIYCRGKREYRGWGLKLFP
jgi:hypothetical protein